MAPFVRFAESSTSAASAAMLGRGLRLSPDRLARLRPRSARICSDRAAQLRRRSRLVVAGARDLLDAPSLTEPFAFTISRMAAGLFGRRLRRLLGHRSHLRRALGERLRRRRLLGRAPNATARLCSRTSPMLQGDLLGCRRPARASVRHVAYRGPEAVDRPRGCVVERAVGIGDERRRPRPRSSRPRRSPPPPRARSDWSPRTIFAIFGAGEAPARSERPRYLLGDDGKAATVLAGPGRLDARIEGEKVRAIGNEVDRRHDVADLFGARPISFMTWAESESDERILPNPEIERVTVVPPSRAVALTRSA